MNKTLYEILQSRQDLSDYVFHFTKNKNAKNTLREIIQDGEIKDINNNGYICFSEAPVTVLPPMFDVFRKYNDPMYAPYGIGIKKDFIYNEGGRPVIYGNQEEALMLPHKLLWRFVNFAPNKVVSIEEIQEINNMTKQQLETLLANQGEQEAHYLGSTWD